MTQAFAFACGRSQLRIGTPTPDLWAFAYRLPKRCTAPRRPGFFDRGVFNLKLWARLWLDGDAPTTGSV
jgi:hypothetical protein